MHNTAASLHMRRYGRVHGANEQQANQVLRPNAAACVQHGCKRFGLQFALTRAPAQQFETILHLFIKKIYQQSSHGLCADRGMQDTLAIPRGNMINKRRAKSLVLRCQFMRYQWMLVFDGKLQRTVALVIRQQRLQQRSVSNKTIQQFSISMSMIDLKHS